MAAENGAETIEFTTYPPSFNDDGTEYENYDDEQRAFVVPRKWAEQWVEADGDVTFAEFLMEWTWDESLLMYEAALAEGVLIADVIESR